MSLYDWVAVCTRGLIRSHATRQSLTEQLKRTRDDDEAQYLNQRMQAVIARLYCMTGQSKVQGAVQSGGMEAYAGNDSTCITHH